MWKSVLRDIRLDVRLGIHAHEQDAPQPISVSVELFGADGYSPVGRRIDRVIDYDRVRDFVLAWRARPQVPLIEELLAQLVDFCFEDERVGAVQASILKTAIFPETREAGVEVRCTRASWSADA